ncbi:DUF87 domain-containing protein [Alkalihalobacillus oceani]|uniref:DUF87 domain-containing protein n=1 Tax=Halalkalibacter oceani TaxID=1653776 RepID=A0A9X2DWD0_9BACI|nr:DUF87 domain-containing protein [Halalkalibacter oceani]MCM3716620.1 DUF87 domain-containing protein [Halalkalibacter oceani]
MAMLNRFKKKREAMDQSSSRRYVYSRETKATGKDFIAPSSIKETLPGDETYEGTHSDYLVEIGSTIEPVRYFRTIFAEITGGNTWAGMLDQVILGEFGKGDTDIAIHVDPVDTADELEDINRRIQGIESDIIMEKNSSTINNLRDELADLKDRQKRLRRNIESPFNVSIQIVSSATEIKTLKKYTNNLIRKLAGRSIVSRSPDGKQLDALLNITPLSENPMYKEHTFGFETANVADLFPFGHGGISHKSGIIIGKDHLQRPIHYDGWHKDLMNHNMVIVGRSGGGKTFAAMVLTHRSAHIGIRTAIIDPKGDYKKFVLEMGCPYIDLSPDSEHRINFFDVDIEEDENGVRRVNVDETVAAAAAIIFKMIRTMDDAMLKGNIKAKIKGFIRDLYKEREITSDPDSIFDHDHTYVKNDHGHEFSIGGTYKKMPVISDLYKKMVSDPVTAEVAELIKPFTQGGGSPSQAIFDGQSTVKIQNVPIFAFGLQHLDEEEMRPIGTFIATKWQSAKFAKKNRHIQKRVIYDESQTAMSDPELAAWLENEYRVLRFFNTSMCAITQGFEVFTRVPQGLGILKNSPTKLFFKQDPIDIEEITNKFDLTDGEGDFLVRQAKEGLGILRIDEQASIINVDSTPEEFALFNTNPNVTTNQFQETAV